MSAPVRSLGVFCPRLSQLLFTVAASTIKFRLPLFFGGCIGFDRDYFGFPAVVVSVFRLWFFGFIIFGSRFSGYSCYGVLNKILCVSASLLDCGMSGVGFFGFPAAVTFTSRTLRSVGFSFPCLGCGLSGFLVLWLRLSRRSEHDSLRLDFSCGLVACRVCFSFGFSAGFYIFDLGWFYIFWSRLGGSTFWSRAGSTFLVCGCFCFGSLDIIVLWASAFFFRPLGWWGYGYGYVWYVIRS